MSVVVEGLRGIAGLRVCDGSVVSANTNAPVLAIADRAASLLTESRFPPGPSHRSTVNTTGASSTASPSGTRPRHGVFLGRSRWGAARATPRLRRLRRGRTRLLLDRDVLNSAPSWTLERPMTRALLTGMEGKLALSQGTTLSLERCEETSCRAVKSFC